MQKRSEKSSDSRSPLNWIGGLLLLMVALAACLAASYFLYASWQKARLGGVEGISSDVSGLNPVELFYLESYLALNADALKEPAGVGEDTLSFVVAPGETADLIASNLLSSNLVKDEELFRRYVRYTGLDSQLEMGTYRLSPAMSIPELATALSQATIQEVEIRFLDGWRIAEMVDYLKATTPAAIDPLEFESIAQGNSTVGLSEYGFLDLLPSNTSLEGYLAPGYYRLPTDAGALFLIDLMLSNFDQQLSQPLRRSFAQSGLTIHEAVTLASIIEKETSVESEMPIMASVYLNRLQDGMLLQADPTVQYALGYNQDTSSWWKSPLAEFDLAVDSPYNTYLYGGLPPGPISNPTLSSLQAVATPAETGYLFFVADCEAELQGSHVFSFTFDEHLANVNRCR